MGRERPILWCRETWAPVDFLRDGHPLDEPVSIGYRADLTAWDCSDGRPGAQLDTYGWNWGAVKWKPSIHMPRWASRPLLEIEDVRVERIQQITLKDISAEGIEIPEVDYSVPDHPWALEGEHLAWAWQRFAETWDRIYGEGAWDRNDWVWRIAFRRLEP